MVSQEWNYTSCISQVSHLGHVDCLGFFFVDIKQVFLFSEFRSCERSDQTFGAFLGEYHFTSFHWEVICWEEAKCGLNEDSLKIRSDSYPLLTVVAGDLWIISALFF